MQSWPALPKGRDQHLSQQPGPSNLTRAAKRPVQRRRGARAVSQSASAKVCDDTNLSLGNESGKCLSPTPTRLSEDCYNTKGVRGAEKCVGKEP